MLVLKPIAPAPPPPSPIGVLASAVIRQAVVDAMFASPRYRDTARNFLSGATPWLAFWCSAGNLPYAGVLQRAREAIQAGARLKKRGNIRQDL